jgi:hypothetical protein
MGSHAPGKRPRRVTRQALTAVARSIRWLPLGTASLLSVLIVLVRSGEPAAGPMEAVAILLAGGTGFILDDPAAEILAASPTPLSGRRSLRFLLVVPPLTLLWGFLLWWQGSEGIEETLGLGLLFGGLVGLSLAAAGVAGRTSWLPSRGGLAAPPTILVLVFLSDAIPRQWRPLPFGDVPGGWTQIYIRWAAAAAVGALALMMSSRDPAGGSLLRSSARRSGRRRESTSVLDEDGPQRSGSRF